MATTRRRTSRRCPTARVRTRLSSTYWFCCPWYLSTVATYGNVGCIMCHMCRLPGTVAVRNYIAQGRAISAQSRLLRDSGGSAQGQQK